MNMYMDLTLTEGLEDRRAAVENRRAAVEDHIAALLNKQKSSTINVKLQLHVLITMYVV